MPHFAINCPHPLVIVSASALHNTCLASKSQAAQAGTPAAATQAQSKLAGGLCSRTQIILCKEECHFSSSSRSRTQCQESAAAPELVKRRTWPNCKNVAQQRQSSLIEAHNICVTSQVLTRRNKQCGQANRGTQVPAGLAACAEEGDAQGSIDGGRCSCTRRLLQPSGQDSMERRQRSQAGLQAAGQVGLSHWQGAAFAQRTPGRMPHNRGCGAR